MRLVRTRSKQKRSAPGDAGYTLTEMLVVLVIIGLLVAIVGSRLFNRLDSAKARTARIQAANIAAAIDMFALDVGRLPTESEGLDALVRAPDDANDWMGPYLARDEVPKDPWGNNFALKLNAANQAFQVASLGSDGREGGDGAASDVIIERSPSGADETIASAPGSTP